MRRGLQDSHRHVGAARAGGYSPGVPGAVGWRAVTEWRQANALEVEPGELV